MAQYSMVLEFSSDDTAERAKRYIIKSGNAATREGATVTTSEAGYYKYAYAMAYKGLPHYTNKSKV